MPTNTEPNTHTAPPPMPDLVRDLIGLSMPLAQAQITVRKLLARADAEAARRFLEMGEMP